MQYKCEEYTNFDEMVWKNIDIEDRYIYNSKGDNLTYIYISMIYNYRF